MSHKSCTCAEEDEMCYNCRKFQRNVEKVKSIIKKKRQRNTRELNEYSEQLVMHFLNNN